MNTNNQTTNTISDAQMDLIDAILLNSERAQCVLKLVSDALIDNECLPAIAVAIGQLKDIDRQAGALASGETINA